jgi:hypothetical protein
MTFLKIGIKRIREYLNRNAEVEGPDAFLAAFAIFFAAPLILDMFFRNHYAIIFSITYLLMSGPAEQSDHFITKPSLALSNHRKFNLLNKASD